MKNVLRIEISLHPSFNDYRRVKYITIPKKEGDIVKKDTHALFFKFVDIPFKIRRGCKDDARKLTKLAKSVYNFVASQLRECREGG